MRKVLLAVDGLASSEISDLLEVLPSLANHLKPDSSACSFYAPLTSASSYWAEFLSGEPWYRTGCFGYASPQKSLNKLSVMREKDLLAPLLLLGNESPDSRSVIVNVPLIQPLPATRDWLSDGSMPIKTKASPKEILENEIVNDYYARPYIDIARAVGPRTHSIESMLLVEQRRTAAVEELLLKQGNWDRCIWRISATDQLTHLLGTGWLLATDLKCTRAIRELFVAIDSLIGRILALGNVEFHLISMFGHVSCEKRFNMNDHLARGGFLLYDDEAQATRADSQRVAASEMLGTRVSTMSLRSTEGRIDTRRSRAASPVAGCVFINSQDVFDDGCVATEHYSAVCKELSEYLRSTLVNVAPLARITENPIPLAQRPSVALPDFVIEMPAVEWSDVRDQGMTTPPRTTHTNEGFYLMPAPGRALESVVSLKQIFEVLNDF